MYEPYKSFIREYISEDFNGFSLVEKFFKVARINSVVKSECREFSSVAVISKGIVFWGIWGGMKSHVRGKKTSSFFSKIIDQCVC